MSKIWFTADTHFTHTNVIKYCSRPFATSDEMDAAMIQAWNAVVAKNDLVFHLGDFAVSRDPRTVRRIFSQLNGSKHLCPGNHDSAATLELRWAKKDHIQFKTVGGVQVVMSHYAMRVWPGQHHGAIQLYGHSHGNLAPTKNSLDVGVDVWGFAPVSIDDIRLRLSEAAEPAIEEPRGIEI